MRKNLFVAAMLLVGCSDGADVAADGVDLIQVDGVESIRIDIRTGAIHMTVSNDDGDQTTIAFTQGAALQAEEGLRSMLLATEQTVSR